MTQSFLATILCSVFGLIGMAGVSLAGPIGGYDCAIIATARYAVGDRNEHDVVSFQYTCNGVDGVFKNAVVTAISVVELDNEEGTFMGSFSLHRSPDGFAAEQLLEGIGDIVVEGDNAVGIEAYGKTSFKFASGALECLAEKTVKFTAKPTGFGKFKLEFMD
ncbi:hypothetical protein ACNJX9_33350 [Bradyrhizobium sp. DASA03076]|uniref:hypothetical protein n=1 Tax=Bradyrhizobium sp. BLXBL-03 TaxID=3395916 RepID=UPI003F6F643B